MRAWALSVGVECCVVGAWSVGQTQHQGWDGRVAATGNASVRRVMWRARTPEPETEPEPMPSSLVATRGVTRGALRVERRVLHRDDDDDSDTRTACDDTRAGSTSFSNHKDQLRLHHSSYTSVVVPVNYGEPVAFRP